MVLADVQATVGDDPQLFVFEDAAATLACALVADSALRAMARLCHPPPWPLPKHTKMSA